MKRHRRTLLFLILFGFWTAAAVAGDSYRGESTISRIDEAYRAGRLSAGDRIFHNMQALFAPDELPPEFRTAVTGVIKSGTEYVIEARNSWDLMSPDQQTAVNQYLSRPPVDTTHYSPSGFFAIHYDTSGAEAVPPADDDFSGVPDYVERIGLYMDSAHQHYQTSLGFYPPPPDGDTLYDVYLLKIGAYGITQPENPGDSAWTDFSSYMMIHCSFQGFPPNDDPEGDVIGAQKVTCAHEFFHATQLAYDMNEQLWWMECTAVYMEEHLFPEVNDNYGYLPDFFDYPHYHLTANSSHMYATFIWTSYLVENYGIGLLRPIFEYCRFYSALPSTDSILINFGTSVQLEFPRFALWNYFTGERGGDPVYHDSGAAYPTVLIDQSDLVFPFVDTVIPVNAPDGLGANYIMSAIAPDTNGFAMLLFDGSDAVRWGLTCLSYPIGGGIEISSFETDFHGRTDDGIYDFGRLDSLLFIPAVVSPWQEENHYNFSVAVKPFGDVDASGEVNILDIVYLINYKYKMGPAPVYDTRLSDANCDGVINILDIIFLITHKYKDGPAPGPCR